MGTINQKGKRNTERVRKNWKGRYRWEKETEINMDDLLTDGLKGCKSGLINELIELI